MKGKVIQMGNAVKLVKELKAARAKDLKARPVRLSAVHRHYTTTKTKAQRDLQEAERINRNAPVTIIKADGTVPHTWQEGGKR